MHFIPSTIEEEKELLTASGAAEFSDLIKIIPSQLRRIKKMGIGHPLSELEIETELQQLCQENRSDNICFLGNGIYDHFIPKAVDFLANRSEYYTAYSPYQAEVSQGTLQYLYEFQTMICELSGMDIANASLYDGASAIAEACLLSVSVTRKSTILYSSLLNEHYIHVMQSYLRGKDINIVALPMPGQDSDSTFIYDAFGVTQYITITGTQTNATLATLITFATTIKALIDGLQSSTVNPSFNRAAIWFADLESGLKEESVFSLR